LRDPRRRIGLAIILALACFAGASCNREPSSSGGDTGEAGLTAPAPAEEQRAPVDRREGTIGRGGALATTLLKVAGLPASVLAPWIDAFGEVLDLRRLDPDDRVIVELAAGCLRRIELARSPRERYEVLRAGDDQAPTARRVPVETERHVRHLAGTVQTSLYEALLAAGGSGETVARVADILAYDIDFFTDPRPGDRFEVLIEGEWLEGERLPGEVILYASYAGQRASQTGYRFAVPEGRADYYDLSGTSLRKALLKSPLNYRRISSTFSHRRLHPIYKVYRPHLGVDFAAPVGTPVVAVGDGTVTFAGSKGANGNLVTIRHAHRYETYYLHLRKIARGVRKGSRVEQGQVIGWVGSTGASTGPHLDFRVKHRGKFVNPLKLTLPPGPPVPAASREAYAAERTRLIGMLDLIPPGEDVAMLEFDRLSAHRERVAHAAALGPYRR
jgi:murein DD-endopeptidase MepM/ murein hydrolase activator NlpD